MSTSKEESIEDDALLSIKQPISLLITNQERNVVANGDQWDGSLRSCGSKK